MLHTLIGYSARPAGIQVLFYVLTLCGILALMNYVNGTAARADATVGAVPEHSG